MSKVVAIGEILIDFTMEKFNNEGYPAMQAHPGGAPANYLATLSEFGEDCALISKVGSDAFGKRLIKTLSDKGLSVKGVVSDSSAFTTLAFVTLDENGDREFSFARKPGADTQLKKSDIDLSLIDEAQVVHFGTLSFTNEPSCSTVKSVIEYALGKNKTITFDPNIRKPLWDNFQTAKEYMLWGFKMADIIKCSEEEIDFLWSVSPEDGAKKILKDYNAKLVFVTLGKNGCIACNKNSIVHIGGYNNVNTVDTTGAGDIFFASAVHRLLHTEKAPDNLNENELYSVGRFACISAGLSTAKHGGIGSIPELTDVIQKYEIEEV